MTTQEQENLAAECSEFAGINKAALAWVEDPANAELVGAQTRSLVRMMRRGARRARRLERSARTRMSVSVFGPSQAGKSFLVSVLARPTDSPLMADFDHADGTLDYIREINPEGEGESTGLVTRFTMERTPTPDGFPVHLTLLSEADIARTIINSFFMDGDRSEPEPDASLINAHLEKYRARSGAERPGLSYDDVHEIAEYVEAAFGREAMTVALRPFWEEAATIAPGLSAQDRAGFFELLWGGHTAFSEMYLDLAELLAELGHAEDVYAGLDALVPRETSIIDVKTLAGGADDAPLLVATADGRQVSLARSRICALAAELVLPMKVLPGPMFAETDLLDFPGARNRFEQDLARAFDEDADAILPELLLRGKVAYLFDRYVQNQEITSMLLCIPDSNMETVDLPGLVQNWIATTHGPSPADRADGDCVLFMVLTKFDKHLSDSAAEGGDETRFERRMTASLLEKFGRGSDDWVNEWVPGKPFDNCFWLRNPNYYVDGLIEYDDNRREARIRPEKEARLTELRSGCLASPSVQRHFSDAEAAWDAALALNDGGVSYLIGALQQVCRPDSKLRQIRAQLDQARAGLRQALAPYHVSDDVEARVADKQEAAIRVIDDLEEALKRHRFGAVLTALMVDQDEVEARIARVPSSVRITSAVTSAAGAGDAPATEALARPGRPLQTSARTVNGEDPAVRTMTLEQFQAGTAIETWIDRLTAFRDDRSRRTAWGLGDTSSADLVAELIHAARRTGLAHRTAERLGQVSFGLNVERQALPASILGSEAINGFVATLGAADMPEGERPQVELPDGSHRTVFQASEPSDTVDNLPAEPRPTASDYWSDWVFALDAMFVANARDSAGGAINVDQNLALGRILTSLSTGVAAE